MATIKSDIRTAQDGPVGEISVGSNTQAEVSFANVKVTHAGSAVAGDQVNLIKLPEGAVFHPWQSSVDAEDLGTNVEFSLTDSNGQVYLTNLNFSTAQNAPLYSVSGSTAVAATLNAKNPITGSNCELYLSASLVSTPTDGAESSWTLVYTT